MRRRWSWPRLQSMLRTEWRHLTAINRSDRDWRMPFAAALATGLPLLIGAGLDRLDFGLVASFGGLVFLYTTNTPLHHRMVLLMAAAFGMTASFALGAMSRIHPPLAVLALAAVATLVTMVCRYYRVGPPGSLFFIMVAAIGAYSPMTLPQLPQQTGLVALGALLACIVAFFHSLAELRRKPPAPVPPRPPATFDFVILDSVIIGVCVGAALAIAQALQLERPYWVPVSCLAVIQGASLRAAWTRHVQRIVGTGVGLLLCWGLLVLPLEKWSIGLLMMALVFVIETLVVRHYGLATVFITPLTILFAEAATLGHGAPDAVMQARFIDTLLGCVVGLAGAVCLHNAGFREVLGRLLRRLLPARLRAKAQGTGVPPGTAG
ncbi:MAG: FUSC family protein [Rhodocyclaceae bacterium]|nr:FUSC family protein [Rhodocyclaceae bacterium]